MSGYHHVLIDTVRPDHPAKSSVRVIAHHGDLSFVEVTSISGPHEDWCLQLDPDTADALAESLNIAATAARRSA